MTFSVMAFFSYTVRSVQERKPRNHPGELLAFAPLTTSRGKSNNFGPMPCVGLARKLDTKAVRRLAEGGEYAISQEARDRHDPQVTREGNLGRYHVRDLRAEEDCAWHQS